MTARATIKQGDLNRLLKAAKAHGFVVELEDGKVRLLPSDGGAVVTSDESGLPAVERALAKWRRSA